MFQRSRWSAFGAAAAIVLGAGVALPSANAAVTSGGRNVFVPIEPCRLFDTRPGSINVGPRSTPLGAGESYVQQVTGTNGKCVIPSDATAVSMNVTAVGGTAGSFLTVYPADASAVPQASNLNWNAGAPATPNKVDVKLSAGGGIGLFNLAGTVDVLADVVGYYADHNHDDRYYTKAQIDASVDDTLRTEVYGPYDLAWEQPALVTLSTNNACLTNTTSSGIYGEVPIHMPVGSRLMYVDVIVLDTAGPTSYSVDVIKTTTTTLGSTTSHVGTVSGLGGTTGMVHTLVAPTGTEIVPAGTSYTARIGSFQNSANAFCSVTVIYDTTP